MRKKNLNVDGITNELEGASLFFSKSVTPLPPNNSKPKDVQSSGIKPLATSNSIDQSSINSSSLDISPSREEKKPTNEVTNERTSERLKVRNRIRHTFDIFADQLMSLRELSIEQEKTFGERVLLGDLVQQALDLFISKQRNK
jgi:hypothetical protein